LATVSEGEGELYDSQVVETCLRLFSEGRFAFGN